MRMSPLTFRRVRPVLRISTNTTLTITRQLITRLNVSTGTVSLQQTSTHITVYHHGLSSDQFLVIVAARVLARPLVTVRLMFHVNLHPPLIRVISRTPVPRIQHHARTRRISILTRRTRTSTKMRRRRPNSIRTTPLVNAPVRRNMYHRPIRLHQVLLRNRPTLLTITRPLPTTEPSRRFLSNHRAGRQQRMVKQIITGRDRHKVIRRLMRPRQSTMLTRHFKTTIGGPPTLTRRPPIR